MVFNSSELKDVCSKILAAVDSSENSLITDTLELEVIGEYLNLKVTNREYYVNVKLRVGTGFTFHASVNAGLFLKLISSLTEETVELEVVDTYLKVTSNGTYKLPLIYDGKELLKLPEIMISNVTQSFDVEKNVLQSILKNNLNELNKGVVVRPVQKLVFVDENGSITFTTGACVVDFKLPSPIKLLLNPKVVKLFKLFKEDKVNLSYGIDDLGGGVLIPKIVLSDSVVTVSSILTNDTSMYNSVPAKAIRDRATCQYNYSANLNTLSVLNAIKRLSLFANKSVKSVLKLHFLPSEVTISDENGNNETIKYSNDDLVGCDYTASLSTDDLKLTFETYSDEHVSCNFGNHQAFVITKQNVYNVLPEVI